MEKQSLRLEETVADLVRQTDDLSDQLRESFDRIAVLERRMDVLLRREAERDEDAGIAPPIADQRPPHW